ncbi:MAG: DUF5683 domain-containing protein, partial [Bacteroidota bacterium]
VSLLVALRAGGFYLYTGEYERSVGYFEDALKVPDGLARQPREAMVILRVNAHLMLSPGAPGFVNTRYNLWTGYLHFVVMSRSGRQRIFIPLLGLLFLGLSTQLFAQTDSLSLPVDTSKIDSPIIAPVDMPTATDSMLAINPLLPATDSIIKAKKKPLKKLVEGVKKQLPRITGEEEKAKLVIPIPWEEYDIKLPWPKGLQPQGPRPPFDPEVAWQRSLMIPGWGQAYNKSYWKIPLFYGGYGVAALWIDFNQRQYTRHRNAFLLATDEIVGNEDPDFDGFDNEGIRTRRNKFRRDRDYAIVILAGYHLLHVVEAYVDAHLKGFDVSEDLSFDTKIRMTNPVPNSPMGPLMPGVAFSLQF